MAAKNIFNFVSHFNPRSPQGGATQCLQGNNEIRRKISIHAPHEGERRIPCDNPLIISWISIHAPHEGERRKFYVRGFNRFSFQSTLPTRGSGRTGATSAAGISAFQSTLPTRGSDGVRPRLSLLIRAISIHAPHEGERPLCFRPHRTVSIFQSTLPTRGSDAPGARGGQPPPISIHAPHEGERHSLASFQIFVPSDFNPRSPRGGATISQCVESLPPSISIHAPHEGERRGGLCRGKG